MAKIKNVASFRDSIHYLSRDIDLDRDLADYLSRGLVGGLMATGMNFETSIKHIVFYGPDDLRVEVFPEPWQEMVRAYIALRYQNKKE
jgi:hypothetical protein